MEEVMDDDSGESLFHQLMAQRTDLEEDARIVLQRLVVIARHAAADRTQLGAHYEKLNSQLSRQYPWDRVTGLLLLYPSCLLHVVESSREVLLSVVKDLTELQHQPDGVSVEASRLFVAQQPPGRLFQQWSHKVLDVDREVRVSEDQSTETLVCGVLSALQRLGEQLDEQLETSEKAGPGAGVSQEILHQLLARDELLTPQQHLQMFSSPLSVRMDFGGAVRSSCLTSV